MQSLTRRIARIGFAAIAVFALVCGAVAPVGAAQNVVNSVTLTGTPITFVATPVTVSTSLFDASNAAKTAVDFYVEIVVVDASATNAGWKLNASATTFTGLTTTSETLGAITAKAAPSYLTDVQVGTYSAINSCIAPLCYTPTNSVNYPVTINATTAKFANAAASTGQGIVPLKQTFSVVVPANVSAQAYASTMTIDIASAP